MFRLPIVKFFSRILNRATITIVLVALQVLWLLWAFWAFTAGRVWLNGLLKALSIVIVLGGRQPAVVLFLVSPHHCSPESPSEFFGSGNGGQRG